MPAAMAGIGRPGGVGGSGSGTSPDGDVTVVNSGTSTSGVDAEAIYAQSIGGGGGSGGSSSGWFSVGGNGGGGGNSDVVTVNNTGSLVKTAGNDSAAIFAQSIGGGGGKGGNSVAVGAFVSMGIGGDGGTGGSGNKVDITSTGADIQTSGSDSCGIYAQSIGGGGGKGGFATSASIGYKVSLSIGAGGDGGSGGNADAVTVRNSSKITTGYEEPPSETTSTSSTGNIEAGDADGIFAESVGGGGGKGGFSITGGASDGAQLGLSVGGQGGKGGNGATVDVTNSGTITTYGESSNGICAQTTGGGGGNGGFSIAGGIGGAASFNMAVGGSGGDGGSAGQVILDNSGDITAWGDTSHAIMAQSTGGGGGNGGMSITASITALTKGVSAGLSIGGSGGKGGKGGDVYVGYTVVDPVTRNLATKAATGTLTTHGDKSDGVFAQSVGGGGGQGGSSLAFSFSNDAAEGASFTGDFSFGGTGGAGNTGGIVQVASGCHIVTTGDSANGIYAQSIGGGGGAGGSATSIALSTSGLFPAENFEGSTFKLKLAVGGSGGDGGKGGSVNVTNTGNIETTGALSRGIFAQSIGGGGGSVAESILGKAEKYLEGTEGFLDSGEIVKSITEVFKEGSPKSLVPHDLQLNVGGNGGANGDAGTVSVTNSGTIHTVGMASHGIFAQSIGGGGGEAQAYAKGTEVEDDGSGGEEEVPGTGQTASVGVAIVGKFAIGGAGGAAGNGSTVTVGNSGTITVDGEGSFGIYAQSIGGGGGQAGSIAGGFSGLTHIGLNPAFGRDGGSGGNGADVTVTNSGSITTHGAGGIGIVAQSIGGGGGMVGDATGIAFAGSVGGYGHSGTVNILENGSILTTGEAAHGIFAQSCGGISGTDETDAHLNPDNYDDVTKIKTDFTGGGGPVNVTLAGTIDTQGANSTGILAQSGGAAGAGNVTVTVNSGWVNGGSGSGCAVGGQLTSPRRAQARLHDRQRHGARSGRRHLRQGRPERAGRGRPADAAHRRADGGRDGPLVA